MRFSNTLNISFPYSFLEEEANIVYLNKNFLLSCLQDDLIKNFGRTVFRRKILDQLLLMIVMTTIDYPY